ncbi:UvrD-helicase domain-containing protein [uncultured Friedmanniella sp.]|uniref:UvrD-helicase domain-containing protein n=1 Tax=uncultured Friedmanniella sp. TaxID=335381 RepID=UPI0035CBADEA
MSACTLVMTKPDKKLDPSLQKLTYAFLEKLTTDDATPGLHIEPITHSSDARVRTGRVNQQYRAVLFKLDGGTGPLYVFLGVWNHDEAITVAQKSVLSLNPVNGITEVRMVEPAEPAPTSTPSPPAPVDELPAILGYTVAELVGQLGLGARLAESAARAASEDELLDLAAGAPPWQGLALVDLASGVSLSEVQDKLNLQPQAPELRDAGEEERLVAGLRHPAARLTFAYIEDDEELRRIIEGGDLDAWRVFLHPEQRGYVDRDTTGPFRLSGGAGTGKTVVLLHRARRLARARPMARILLTTYTTNLARQLGRDLVRLDPTVPRGTGRVDHGVSVTGVDAFAAAVLREAEDLEPDSVAVLGASRSGVSGRTDTAAAWREAVEQSGSGLPESLRSPAFFEAEYAMVVLPNRITDLEAYLRVRRPGRGVRLSRGQRRVVWSVVESYRLAARAAGTVDFGEAAALAAAHLARVAAAGGERWFDHVLVDEGQDLSPAQWQLVRAAVAEGANDVFLAEDSHQRIYGHRLTLSHYGLRITGRSRRLTLNYRTTAENLAYAVQLLEAGSFTDLEDAAEDSTRYRSARSGPPPRRAPTASLTDELQQAADLVRTWVEQADAAGIPRGTIAVLVRDRFQRDRVVTGLAERGVTVRGVEREAAASSEPVVMTMHRAKGTEFYQVLMFGMSEASVPKGLAAYDYSDDDRADALLRERSLLYVAATRARDELVVSWTKTPSPLLVR